MLAATYRIQAQNSTGVAFAAGDTITIKAKRWNIGSTGARVAESAEATLTAAGTGNSLAIGGYANSNAQDNTAAGTLWFGGEFKFSVTLSPGGPSGPVNFYMQQSTDGGTSWPDNGTGQFICTIFFVIAGTQNQSIEY